jgi:hypothetical protein
MLYWKGHDEIQVHPPVEQPPRAATESANPVRRKSTGSQIRRTPRRSDPWVDAVRTILVPPKARIVRVRPRSADLEFIAHLVDDGRIVPIVEHVFPLDRIVEATRGS